MESLLNIPVAGCFDKDVGLCIYYVYKQALCPS
jgi:hypothetical protein